MDVRCEIVESPMNTTLIWWANKRNGVHQAHLFDVTTIQIVDHWRLAAAGCGFVQFECSVAFGTFFFYLLGNLNCSLLCSCHPILSHSELSVSNGGCNVLSAAIGGQFWYRSLWIEWFYGIRRFEWQNDGDSAFRLQWLHQDNYKYQCQGVSICEHFMD